MVIAFATALLDAAGTLHGLNAGVIRTAIKRSQLEPIAFEPVLHHRAAIADRLVAALASRTKEIGANFFSELTYSVPRPGPISSLRMRM